MFALDRFEGDYAILENLETKEKREVLCSLLPKNLHEGVLLNFVDDKYILEPSLEEKRRNDLRARLNKLKNM